MEQLTLVYDTIGTPNVGITISPSSVDKFYLQIALHSLELSPIKIYILLTNTIFV